MTLNFVRVPAIVLVVLSLLLLLCFAQAIATMPALTVPQAAVSDPWVSGYEVSAHLMGTRYSLDDYTPIPQPPGWFPEPPDCKKLGIKECRWEIREKPSDGEGHVVEVLLKSGDRIVGEVQLMETPVSYAADLAPAASHTDTVWIAFVRVAKFARINGIGRAVWRAGDAAISLVGAMDGRDRVYRVVCDQAGWIEALIRDIPASDIIHRAGKIVIYEIVP